MIRCPLCLETLKQDSRLLRFCVSHQHQPVEISPFGPLSQLECPDERRGIELPVSQSVFLLHRGCRCTNPFWNEERRKVIVPERVIDISQAQVDHWIIEVLRAISSYAPLLKEMWFPSLLYKAANNHDYTDMPIGALVMMMGARKAGKTVLATMALLDSTYQGGFNVEDFVHITRDSSSQQSNELLHILDSIKKMKKSETLDPPPATDAGNLSNIKSAYLSLSDRPLERTTTTFRKYMQEVVRNMLGSPQNTKERVVAFYDMAGEFFERPLSMQVLSLDSKMDILAVVLDATALRGMSVEANPNTSVDSVKVAMEHLSRTRGYRARRCIIVTKLDLIKDNELEEFKKKGETIDDGAARKMLLRWLKGGRGAENGLYRAIKNDPSLHVFFIWTSGIEKQGEAVTCFGMMPFVAWCLGEWAAKQISRKSHA